MDVVVLSPHRDDAAFSCGLLMRALMGAGAALHLVNVCTISSYAPWLPEGQSRSVADITETRENEDKAFLQNLLDSVGEPRSLPRMTDLGWLDAPLRWNIEADEVLTPHTLRAGEVRGLQDAFEKFASANLVLVPMAVGNHMDHRLVRAAATRVFHAAQAIFYEDLPYVCRVSGPASDAGHPAECLLPLQPASGWKRQHALCYPSQIDTEVADEMERYAESLGGRERYYSPPETLQRTVAFLTERDGQRD